MIDLQKRLCHQNLCHIVMKKIKIIFLWYKIAYTKKQVKKYKIKTSQWINDDKSVYICFVYHKLVTEIDEYGHPYYENNEKQQKLIENLY